MNRMGRQSGHRFCAPRGGILLEVLVSLALFVGAGTFTYRGVSAVFSSIEISRREMLAADLARSKMAELEAGLISIADLRNADADEVGTVHMAREHQLTDAAGQHPGWMFDVDTQPTEFPGLTLVTLTVSEQVFGMATLEDDDSGIVSYTLRQLVALRGEDAEAYEQDEILEGLPEGEDLP